MKMKLLTQALLASSLALGGTVALAQSTTEPVQRPDTAAPATQNPATYGADPAGTEAATSVSEEQLEKFADAKDKVLEIQRDYTQKISDAGDQTEAQQLQAEAQQEMIEAVDDAGLDVQTYNQLASRMQTDSSFRQQVDQMR